MSRSRATPEATSNSPSACTRPYLVSAGGATIGCLFRDHALSDLIGFNYSGWAADAAADDFVARLVEAGRRFTQRTGGEEAVVPIILDGENAWEHFEGGGRPFLRELYGRLGSHPELRTVTMAEACEGATRQLPGIFPGSWIDANFYIWIGHPDDQRAWSQLAEARAALDETEAGGDPAAVAAAQEEVFIAEGSDWCWWYGDDHSSAHDLEFDELYRRHLRNVYQLLKKPIPDELFISNISRGLPTSAEAAPCALIAPTIDGEPTSYFEWLGAGVLEVRVDVGAMHQVERQARTVTLVQFGFDRLRLYVRLDGGRRLVDLLREGYEFTLKFLRPEGLRFSVAHKGGRVAGTFWERSGTPPQRVDRGAGGSVVAAGTVLEMALPLGDLGLREGDRVSFFVAVYDAHSNELERHPVGRPIEADVPDARFVAANWAV